MLSHTGHVLLLANSIIGVGILAMPFCFQKCGIVLSILLILVSNWTTRICCHYLIKTSLLTRRKSFEFLGFHAFGFSGKLLVELCIIGYLLGSCITYFVVVGDLGPQIIRELFSLESSQLHLRTIIMIVVTVVCIIPLGMLKNVDSLSMVCTASIGFYVCLVLKIILESGEHILQNDWTTEVVYWRPAGVLQCLPIFSMALSCQMQLFEVFQSVNNQSLEKLNGIVRNATWICTLVYIAVGFFGYVAFCTQTFSGNILMNFSTSFSSYIIKIGFILSVAFSFPLVIFPCRASIYSLLYRKGHDTTGYIPETRFKLITVFIVVFSLCVALIIPSVELVIGLVGSTIGVAICIMFPAACFRKIIKKESTERSLAQLILIAGFFLMILGTYANLSAIDEQRSGPHLDELSPEKPATPDSLKIFKAELLNDLKKELKDEKIDLPGKDFKEPEIAKKLEANSPPPLPVDEVHKHESDEKPVELLKPVEKSSSSAPPKEVVEPKPHQEEKAPKVKSADKPLVEDLKDLPTTVQQSIDKEAIKKEEEVVAEEQKNKNSPNNVDELMKTQKELKATKELLERTVGELKQELAKQNQETQNLVVEKLEEVVEKVEQIERKVQQQPIEEKKEPAKGEDDKPKLPLPSPEPPKSDSNATLVKEPQQQQQQQKGSLLSILKDNNNSSNSAHIYEPLSYKTGELVENVRNNSKTDQRLPLPLALLINAAQAKMNVSIGPVPQEKPVDIKVAEKNHTQPAQAPADDLNLKAKAEEAERDKANVEAIRREILQVNSKHDIDTTVAVPQDDAVKMPREKRSIVEGVCDNCLDEPKIESLMAHGLSGSIELQSHSIVGRDLLNVDDDNQKDEN